MISNTLNLEPVKLLLDKHKQHYLPYDIQFKDIVLRIHPDVFNPSYTKVSGFIADHVHIPQDSDVLDMFTGSGAIGLYTELNARFVLVIDISEKAIACANENADLLGLKNKTEFRVGNLWESVRRNEQFDVIIANPPLLPAIPENLLEMAVADGPEMALTKSFIEGATIHLKNNGVIIMALSNACKPYVGDPIAFVSYIALKSGLTANVKAEWDVGYEIYRIIEFTKK